MTTAPEAGAPPRAALLAPPPTSAPAPPAEALPPVRRLPLAVAGVIGAALTRYVFAEHGARPGVLLLLGIGLGIA
ncbi:YeeE/YedE family protein, partial [Streptomyces alfalfae]